MGAEVVGIGELIVASADRYGGWPCISGKGYPVALVAIAHAEGASPEEIVVEQPQLTPAEGYAALAYYFLNKTVIDEQIAVDAAAFESERARLSR